MLKELAKEQLGDQVIVLAAVNWNSPTGRTTQRTTQSSTTQSSRCLSVDNGFVFAYILTLRYLLHHVHSCLLFNIQVIAVALQLTSIKNCMDARKDWVYTSLSQLLSFASCNFFVKMHKTVGFLE